MHQRPGSSKMSSISKNKTPTAAFSATPMQMLGQAPPQQTHILSNNQSMVIRNSNSMSNMSAINRAKVQQ
jgi:hypothetical protein